MKKLIKTHEEWSKLLTDKEFEVCRLRGTEEPFTGKLLHNQQTGDYHCVCCQAILFKSSNKYDSGCGWPSFDAPVNESALTYLCDRSHGMERTEIRCARCDSHLGHVFPDGPKSTGQRYCVNSVSLVFNNNS